MIALLNPSEDEDQKRQTSTLAEDLEQTWYEWQDSIRELNQLGDVGWESPEYGPTLLQEQATYQRFLTLQKTTRRRALPVR